MDGWRDRRTDIAYYRDAGGASKNCDSTEKKIINLLFSVFRSKTAAQEAKEEKAKGAEDRPKMSLENEVEIKEPNTIVEAEVSAEEEVTIEVEAEARAEAEAEAET